jgi:type II secretory pathway pseudopilin PulG
MAEVIVSVSILAMVFAGLGITLAGFARFNGAQWARQQCLAAAQAQLDSLVVTGRPLTEDDLERLWPHMTVATNRTPGRDQWEGLDLLEVTASMNHSPLRATVRLARYVLPTADSDEGGQP